MKEILYIPNGLQNSGIIKDDILMGIFNLFINSNHRVVSEENVEK